ncbi:MAG TPA: hypothetical protein VFX43_02710 [Chitinophagaceae bacterium]|nr:hypothetical protein [Chitinophagaceae bacterium]
MQKSGSRFSYKGKKVGQGRGALHQLLDNPEMANEIKRRSGLNWQNWWYRIG